MTAQTLDEQNDEDPVYTASDVLDANGSPKGSNGGKDPVNADDPDADWSFESATMLDTSLNGQMTLILKKGTFDFRGSTVRCPVKIASSSAKLLGGTFTDIVCNTSGSYECINGVFLKCPEKDVDGGNVTGALRCVEMYTDSAIGDLSYTVNGEPLEGNEFYYMSYDESDDYKQEIALTCSGESTDLIKSWNVSEAYGTESIISRGRSLIRDAYGKGHTCTISVSSNDITQLHITVSGSVSTYMFLMLTAQTTADPDEGSLQFHAAMNEHFLPGFPASEVPLFLPLRQSFIVFAFFQRKVSNCLFARRKKRVILLYRIGVLCLALSDLV